MTRAALTLVSALALLSLGAPAFAADAPIRLDPPVVKRTGQGAEFHGAVCRAGGRVETQPLVISLEQGGSDGSAVAARTTLPGALKMRNRSCAFYSLATAKPVADGDSWRVCARSAGREVCAEPRQAD